jgi:hypothetical protein
MKREQLGKQSKVWRDEKKKGRRQTVIRSGCDIPRHTSDLNC